MASQVSPNQACSNARQNMAYPPALANRLVFEVHSGVDAESLLSNESLFSRWQQLYAESFASPFLSPKFASVWVQHYRHVWTPVLVVARDSRAIQGIMPLAMRDQLITGLGAHQAEYHGWICTSSCDETFLGCALSALSDAFPQHHVRLRYLVGRQVGVAQAVARAAAHIRIKMHTRPLLALEHDVISAAFRKRSNKNKINRIKRHGSLEVMEITDSEDFLGAFDDIIALYDFRQGAVHDSCPFASDPEKKSFHLDWFRSAPDQLRISCLRLNGRVIGAMIGVSNGIDTSLAIPAFSAEYSKESLGRLIIYFGAKALAEIGQRYLDLTPGGDSWKQEVATEHAPALELNVYGSAMAARWAAADEAMLRGGRRMLTALGIAPQNAKYMFRRLRRLNLRKIATRLYCLRPTTKELRIYRLDLATHVPATQTVEIGINKLDDLLRFRPSEPWQNRGDFLAEALRRIELGHKVYTICSNNMLVHFGWLAPQQKNSCFPEVQQTYSYPDLGAVLYDFYTLPAARNQGYYRLTIGKMLADVQHNAYAAVAYISVLARNGASRHVIERLGFEYTVSLFSRRFLWRNKKWSSEIA